MATKKYQFVVPGDAKALCNIRWVVTRLATAAGLPVENIDQIEVAVDEACTNVLDHAYKSRNPKPPIHLEIQTDEDGTFTVDVLDTGDSFDFAAYVPPKFPDHWIEGHERGVGLFLISQFMDDVQYETLETKQNRLRMIKRCKITADRAPEAVIGA